MFSRNGTLTITGCTFAQNVASSGSSLFLVSDGVGNRGTATADNTILYDGNAGVDEAAETAINGGLAVSAAGATNVIEDRSGAFLSLGASTVDPALSPLASNGGPSQTHALPSGVASSAKGSGNSAKCGPRDQRGFARRTGNCDVGAFEVQPDALTIVAGDNQSSGVGSAFANSLAVDATEAGSALQGVAITFAAPTSGPSAVLNPATPATDANGRATSDATANSIVGVYQVTASINSMSVSFNLSNQARGGGVPLAGSKRVVKLEGEDCAIGLRTEGSNPRPLFLFLFLALTLLRLRRLG